MKAFTTGAAGLVVAAVLLVGAYPVDAQMVAPAAPAAALGLATPDDAAPPPPEYRLRPGDVVHVKLFYSPELNEQLPVRPDGRISLELVGELVAAGRTTAELADRLTEKYAAVLRDPEVAVIVKEIAPRRIYVAGEVNAPGVLAMAGETSLLQSIVQAGGHKRSAKLKTVVVLRYQGTTEPRFFTVDLQAALRGRGPDVLLQSYDIVFVPKTRVAKVNDFMAQYVREVVPLPLSLGISYVFGGVFR